MFISTGLDGAMEMNGRVTLQQMIATGGPATEQAANTALSGDIAQVRQFLTAN